MSSHVLDISASLKRKTESTHQAKSDVQPNKKTQSSGTKRNLNENQPKHIDVEHQPQGRPVTHVMVESQSTFATHSGQEITQPGFFEIQTKSTSPTVNEAVTKPASENVSFQNPVIIANTTVPQTSQRRSARTRNSICGFTVQAEDNSATSKLCQSVLSISHADGSNIERLVCKNDQMAALSIHDPDTAASLKRKTQSTHQAKSDVQPNTKTQSAGTVQDINENQPKHIDVEQPQGRPVTRDMVESQTQFATHSGQEITQSDFLEIQTKSASTTVTEAVIKPAGSNVSFQNPVVIGNTTVSQTSLRWSARSRNSICGFTVQAEDNSATSKLCQSALSTSHAEGSNIERMVFKNDKMAAMSIHDPDTAASLKRKTQGTHQAKSDVQPNTKTQSAGTVHNVNENQPKHIDVEQPQRRPVTRDMVESQSNFVTHSGQKITQSDFFEIQTKSASTTVNEAVTKPDGSNVSFHNPAVIGNTTVPETSLRRSARSRNSICGFTVQAEDNSATPKPCQSVLSISHAEGSNIERLVCKNDTLATMSSHVLDISASLKRKTESTHQAKSDVQPNKKTQSSGTKRNLNENQPKHIDVEHQPQGRPVTHVMVESQSTFATHSGQEITQPGFFEIQTKSTSPTVNEAVTKPASENVSFQNPVIIANTTVPQTSQRRSARTRNSICGFTVQAEDNSATSKLCQSVLSISHADGSNIERLVCKNDQMAALSIHDPDTAASLKRKTQSTHQAKSDVQPNTKTQSAGTVQDINENQPKHIDVEQPQGRPVTRDMVESQTQFATHSGQEITQSDFLEIQTKSASTTVTEAVIKPAGSNVSFQNPVVIGNTTVSQTSLRWSARSRNSICGFTVQAEDNSATSKLCQSALSTSHAEGSNIERMVFKNDKMAAMSIHDPDTAASLKRKTQGTHQAKSDVQPNTKTQSAGTVHNVNENQPKHIDVEQPQRRPVTRDMVESQSNFVTHSGQKITQSDFFEIQTKSASTTVNEAVTKPDGSNVSFHNPAVIGNTTVPETSLRRSARSRNSICGFTVQAEDNSATPKPCQSVLSISHAEGSNIERLVCKNDTLATMSSHVLDISASLKRKTESTHQAKSDVQPNKKTQSSGTKRNLNENQPKHIDVEHQPQGRPVTHVMVESQSTFATHSGQEITQPGFFEIQTKSTSPTVNEAVTKPASENVSFQNPVIIANTTVPQTSQRRSARTRNSICGFTVQAEDNSATSKLCQSVLSISHADGSNIERLVCKNDQMAALSIHDPDTAASLKRKTQSTHQAKSDVQPNTKTQSAGTVQDINENQPKHIDVEQPQGRPVTRDMVESQTQFATHSGQEITQSDFLEIQTKSASTTVTEAVIKPAGSNVSFQNPVVIGNTTVSQTSLRWSARSRNSICGFTVQAEDNSATSKLCQSALSTSHAEGSNIERMVFKNDKMAAMSIHDPDTAASLKRKTQGTHQAKSDVQPNTKTQSAGTVHNVNENQPKHIDVEQPQRRPVTRDMVESQSNFVTHSGQKITQSDFFEIQTKSASTTVNEAVTKPDGSNVSFHNPAVIGNTTVPETSLRRSARSRNSICGFTVQAEDNSAIPKPCQSVLSISHAEGSNIERLVCKNDTLATMSSHVLDISASLKRKTESTHQAKSDVQPNKKTQSSGTKRNLNENQPKHIDVEHQPQGRPVTHVMVESQSTFATHSGQEITQPGFFEIQTKSTSPTVNEAVTKPASENVCKNDQMAALSIHDPDTAASLKRKTQSTHQAKSDVQPNTKTQSAGTVQDINENQPKHIDVEQPQGRPVTRDMVESQTQFATHSGQEITQSDFLEIQTKSASTTVTEAVIKPAGSNVSFQNPVVIGNTTVSQTSLRWSARSRNSICGFTVQAEDNSATSKLCQSALSTSHAEGSNIERMVFKNDKMAAMSIHDPDTAASLKRKTQGTHQAKSDVQPNTKTQSAGTVHNVNENQPKHIDVEQPQRRPVTRDMVESQSNFVTHSGQKITQSDFFEIQTKSASTTVNEAVTKPDGSNVSFHNPAVIGLQE
ncbi:uncharacterized protein LOC144592267 [Rhinoraja longicauda]